MHNLKSLLERFTNSLNKDEITRGAVREAVLVSTGVKLSLENITLKDGVLTISAGAAAKNEIRLKEEAIKQELKALHQVNISRIIYK